MKRFRVIATKTNQYGNKVKLLEIRDATNTNAWELSEALRTEGWEKIHIRQINEERLKYSESRYKSMIRRQNQSS